MTAVILASAGLALAWFAYTVGEHTGHKRGRREGRRLAWRDRDERSWAEWLRDSEVES